ncbi:MAG: hypothetical protein LAO76_26350 [Acidobacteriia bacterium]|nr:hypothetical protein [Terriglobia bacterium]
MAKPTFKITTKHVIAFFSKEYRMKVSEVDARRWLKLWGYTFADDLKKIVTPNLAAMFRQATLRDYPSSKFTRFLRRVDEAITAAIDLYAAQIRLEYRQQVFGDEDRCRMATYLMAANDAKREAIFGQAITFGSESLGDEERKFRIHVAVQARKIKARIMDPSEPLPARVRVFGKPVTVEKPATIKNRLEQSTIQ